MKFTLLAAAALIAVPAVAQDTMSSNMPTTTQTAPPTTTDPATTTASDPSAMQQTPTAPQGDTGAAAMDPAMGQSTTSATSGSPMTTDTDPAGGYQPSAPAMQGGMQPGATVRFQAAPPVSQAYPAPAPLQSYPICKRGQYDNCRQRGG